MIGIDIQDLEEFKNSFSNEIQINKILTARELSIHKTSESRCGVFSVKECLVKIGIIIPGEWLKVEVLKDENGKPFITSNLIKNISNIEFSISHSKETCVAVAIKL
ncbi:MAG: 4'-phosphopantetheinyl transferase superfamily protein [Candidatus Dojkabacteria bacterium]|nr:4'-phosphopantetheinyl transferase superfamily protein [Candidatus Dojkabacteria bacterium]MDQ7021193.1 4'-phosphopantetheinyl transferase superfamily protein [Candidatus Dojkabacteria bacterium]